MSVISSQSEQLEILPQHTPECNLICSECNFCTRIHETQCKSNVSTSEFYTLSPSTDIFQTESIDRQSFITFGEEDGICTPDNDCHKISGSLTAIDTSQEDSVHSQGPACKGRDLSVSYRCELRSTPRFKVKSNPVNFDPIKDVKHELPAWQLYHIHILLLQILQNLIVALSSSITTFSKDINTLCHEETNPVQGLPRQRFAFHQKVFLILCLIVCCAKLSTCAHPRECIDSIQTLKKVNDCPTNKQKWTQAAKLKRCDSIQQNCSSTELFQYHCVLDQTGEGLVEVCAPVSNVIGQYCAEYDIKANIIQSRSGASCKGFEPSYPFKYSSHNSYLYQGCYATIRRNTKLSVTAENESYPYTTDNPYAEKKGLFSGKYMNQLNIKPSLIDLMDKDIGILFARPEELVNSNGDINMKFAVKKTTKDWIGILLFEEGFRVGFPTGLRLNILHGLVWLDAHNVYIDKK